jgi:hypothetical protein
MLLNQNTLNLYGEKLFERARVTPPFKRANHLSNEACLLFFSEGGNNHYSQSESLTVTTGDGILMKCGNFFFDLIPDKESGNAEMIAIHFFPKVLKQIFKNAGLGKIGLNAPPSEEDQGRVVAHILKDPSSHASKTYRPTGPKLISLVDVVAIFSKITGKEIKIAEVSQSRFLKSLNSMDAPKVDKDFVIMNVPYYQEELGQNSFAVGPSAVTSVVKDLTGKEPEDFETIARREFENSPELKPTFSNKMKAFKGFLKIIFASEPSIQKLESKYGIPTSKGGYKYVQENLQWVKDHESQLSEVSN